MKFLPNTIVPRTCTRVRPIRNRTYVHGGSCTNVHTTYTDVHDVHGKTKQLTGPCPCLRGPEILTKRPENCLMGLQRLTRNIVMGNSKDENQFLKKVG